MSNNTESNIPVKFTENSNNEWINWIEEAIAKDYFKYYELNHFSNFQEIGFGGFGKVYRVNWKSSPNYLALKSFFNFNNVTIKEIVKDLKSLKFNVKWIFMRILFVSVVLQQKIKLIIQKNIGIIHHDLHSKNVLVHQNMVKLADFGKPYDVCLAINISQGLRETPIPDTPEDCVNIYTDCWNNEPDNRPTINQVVFKLNAIILKNNNMVIKDFRQTNDSYTNQLSSKQQLDLNAFEDPMNNSSHGELSKFIQEFNKMNTKEIDSSISSNINFMVTVDEMVELSDKRGIGTDIDEKKAFELHHKATDLGNTIGINNLGHCYEEGIGTDIDGKKAFELYQKAADLGNAYGINNLGHCYKKGIGTDIDEKKAFELYQKVVDLGNAIGINNLGHCYEKGIGTDIDEKKAFELYQKVADLGNVIGINNLGHCYEKGIGTDIDGKKAFELYQKAADLGNTYGINNLGYCYEKGTGTDIDEKKAFELYQKAADLGNITAQYNLAFMYESGTGILKDINQAIYWYKKSALQGDKDAQNRLEQIHAK
ncbi:kinase-like domain-containing protein [Rhizophagus irregularis DAOM 181602=DAOM 197198]|nr:kinase-like domain-containing protein [Rhizophagus irregularis DAOM 181602=DAOM 197198]